MRSVREGSKLLDQVNQNRDLGENDVRGDGVLYYGRAKEVDKIEVTLKREFGLRFKKYIYNDKIRAFKVQVPNKKNITNVLRGLESYEIMGQRFLDGIPEGFSDLQLKKEIELKLSAVKYFIENYDQDITLFINPGRPESTPAPESEVVPPETEMPEREARNDGVERGACPPVAGKYEEIGPQYGPKSLQVFKMDCNNFWVRRPGEKQNFKVTFSDVEKCDDIGSYQVCSKGEKVGKNVFNMTIKEQFLDKGCRRVHSLTFNLGQELLISSLTYICKERSQNSYEDLQFKKLKE